MAALHMSLEAALDEERRDILAMLEATPSATGARPRGRPRSLGPARAASPFMAPLSPRRSMLDLDDEEWAPRRDSGTGLTGIAPPTLAPRKASQSKTVRIRNMFEVDDEDWAPRKDSLNGEINSAATQSPQTIRSMLDISPLTGEPIRSMLDVGNGYSTSYIGHEPGEMISPTVSSTVSTTSAASSPIEEKPEHAATGRANRRVSDAATTSSSGAHWASTDPNPESAYQFSGFLPSNPGGPGIPKRNTLTGRKTSAVAEAVRGGTMSLFGGDPKDRRRHNVAATMSVDASKSKSPAGRSILRHVSPHTKSPGPRSSTFMLSDGRVIDMKSAYRRLSDANFASSDGRLSALRGKLKQRSRANSENGSYGHGVRLEPDGPSIEVEDAVVDSSEDDDSVSDDGPQRGRKRNERRQHASRAGNLGLGRAPGPRQARSQMAAAEEEREQVAAQHPEPYKVRSLLDPEIIVTTPAGERVARPGKPIVHPWTSFDEGLSGLNTPVDSDTEQDFTDIKRAQKLPINMTNITHPSASRTVRTIYRGDFAKIRQEADDHARRVRKYLVATDLSEEAAHALEWTVGTVLRDGDTLLAIYCVDEEVGISALEASAGEMSIKEHVAALDAATKSPMSTPVLGPVNFSGSLRSSIAANASSALTNPNGQERGKAEQERHRAVQDMTELVSRLLRKTKLQVKVVIEVIHCKSPKHLITEVIDYLQPTMVILGSRGQSQLKGVILGSFSNYLVTKSSVPVMVARKRLRKHNKYKRPAVRLANNLANPAVKSLAAAKID